MNQSIKTKEIYLSLEDFNRDLEICLLIISYPTKLAAYYVCEYTSAALYKSIVHIYIK